VLVWRRYLTVGRFAEVTFQGLTVV
jgi:hypothetical protein